MCQIIIISNELRSMSSQVEIAHSEQAVIAHACHGHTFQLLAGLCVSRTVG